MYKKVSRILYSGHKLENTYHDIIKGCVYSCSLRHARLVWQILKSWVVVILVTHCNLYLTVSKSKDNNRKQDETITRNSG